MSKILLVVKYEIESSDFSDLMNSDGLTLEEAVSQSLDDGDLELNETPIVSWELETERSDETT